MLVTDTTSTFTDHFLLDKARLGFSDSLPKICSLGSDVVILLAGWKNDIPWSFSVLMYILPLHKLSSRWRSFETDKVPPYQPASKRSPRAAPQKPKHALRRICYSTPPGSYSFPISVLPPVNMDRNESRLSYTFDTTIQPSTAPKMRHSDNSARD